MTPFTKIASRIIKEQEVIIGPIAWEEARKVKGLTVVDMKSGEVELKGDNNETINQLVARYERLFGRASREVCRTAVADIVGDLPKGDIPSSLV